MVAATLKSSKEKDGERETVRCMRQPDPGMANAREIPQNRHLSLSSGRESRGPGSRHLAAPTNATITRKSTPRRELIR
jgi:hypothetical protein